VSVEAQTRTNEALLPALQPTPTNVTSDGIITISSGRRCGGVGGKIGFLAVAVTFVLADVIADAVLRAHRTQRRSRRQTRHR